MVLHNPDEEELNDLDSFYAREQEGLRPNLWFIGTEDYHWRPVFEERAQNMGAILLWKDSTTSVSTSELIGDR